LYYVMCFASFQLLIKTGYDCDNMDDNGGDCEDKLAYSVFAALFTLFFVIVHIAVKMIPQIAGVCGCWNQFVEPLIAIILFVFWVISLPILTMPDHENDDDFNERAPYLAVGTGWLMSWICAGTATIMVAPAWGSWYQMAASKCAFLNMVGPAKEASAGLLTGVFLLSLTVMWCAADLCDARDDNDGDCDDEYAWAVCVSLFSCVYCLALLLAGKCLDGVLNGMIIKVCSLILAIWWWLGATVITVTTGPDDHDVFTDGVPANGFFGTWLAFVFSAIMAASHWGVINVNDLMPKF